MDDHTSFDPENEGTETFEGTLRRIETGDALAHEQGKELAEKTARKAKSKSNPPWFTHERLEPLWKIIADKRWKHLASATQFLVDRYNEYLTWGLSSLWKAKAEEIRSKAEINKAIAKKENAVAESISADTQLKQAITKSITSIDQKSKKKQRRDPKSDVKPSDQFLQQLQDEGVAYEVKRDKQGNKVLVVTKILPEEYPPE